MSKKEESAGAGPGVGPLARAIADHREGRLEEAEAGYRAVLDGDPDNVDALHFRGVLRHQVGDSEAALELIGRALALKPSYVDARNNRGNIFKELLRLEEAEADYRAVLERVPDHADALNNLGTMLRARDDAEGALGAYARSLNANPQNAVAWGNLGHLMWSNKQQEEAIKAFKNAVMLDPSFAWANLRLGQILSASGQTAAARRIFRKWLEREPDNAVAAHMLAACTAEDVPDRASAGYVSSVFDDFASSFDRILEGLEYRAPALIAAAFARQWPDGTPVDRVFDLGCGTGLCAEHLHERVRTFVGVDLSAGMLRRAKARGGYDRLVRADLVEFLEGADAPPDALISADTLCYLGDLVPVFTAGANATRNGSLFLFTVELWRSGADDSSGSGFRLNHHGRYSHRRDYVEDTLTETGWEIVEITEDTLRQEGGEPVAGLVVTARRSPEPSQGA